MRVSRQLKVEMPFGSCFHDWTVAQQQEELLPLFFFKGENQQFGLGQTPLFFF